MLTATAAASSFSAQVDAGSAARSASILAGAFSPV